MINSLLKNTLPPLLLLLPCCLPQPAYPQVYASQDGHHLDANPRVGSFGLNPNAQLDALMPRLGNLMITGNVTGGASFQGLVPYQSPGEFGASLGSTSLSNFYRDSIGAPTSVSPRPYYPSSALGAAGLSMHQQPPASPTLHSFSPYVPPSRATTTSHGSGIVGTGQLYQGFNPAAAGPPATPWMTNQVNPLAVRPFGQSLYSLRYPATGLDTERLAPTSPTDPAWAPPSWQQDSPTEPAAQVRPYDPFLDQPAQEPLQPQDLRVQPLDPAQAEQMSQPRSQEPATGQAPQRSASVLEELQAQLQAEARGESLPGQDYQAVLEPTPSTNLLSSGQQAEGAPSRFSRTTPWTPVLSQEAFEQHSRQQYDNHMQRAEQLLKEGQYYHAVNAFDNARLYQPNRGMSYLAKGMALFAAGEFMSAAFFVNHGLQIEPALAAGQEAVADLVNPERTQQQLEEVARWYEQTKRAELLFLKGFILYAHGSLDEAETALQQAAQAVPQQARTIGYLLKAIKAARVRQGAGS